MTFETALIVDVMTVSICILLLSVGRQLRFTHPAVLYLGFHSLVFTFRAISVYFGAEPFLGAVEAEYARALNYADLFLIAATLGWLTYRFKTQRPQRSAVVSHGQPVSFWSQPLQLRYILTVTYFALPVGLYSFVRYAYVPGTTSVATFDSSSYARLAVTWPLLLALSFLYLNGFRWFLTAPTVTMILLLAIQGEGRYRAILPIIAIAQFWTDSKRRRWPGPLALVGFAILFFLFFPLKVIGKSIQDGEDLSSIVADATDTIQYTARGSSSGQAIFDQFAVSLTLTDQHDEFFWGRPYLNVFTLPIPRAWWPGKPGLADHLVEISTGTRPLDSIGGVITVPGDLYLNFGLVGVLVGGFVLARLSLRFFDLAYRGGYGTLGHFAYILFAAASIQVLRDGLFSVYTFALIKNLPAIAIIALHWRGLQRGTSIARSAKSEESQRASTDIRPARS